jgi:hypothetical protein
VVVYVCGGVFIPEPLSSPPPHATRLANAAPPIAAPNTLSTDFMAAPPWMTEVIALNERAQSRLYSFVVR